MMFVVTEDWALISHRLHLVRATILKGNEVSVVARGSGYQTRLEALGVHFYNWSLFRGSLNV